MQTGHANRAELIDVFATPQELEMFAERMRRHLAQASLGDRLAVHVWTAEGLCVALVIDQDRMRAEEGRR